MIDELKENIAHKDRTIAQLRDEKMALIADYMAHERLIAGQEAELARLRAVNAELVEALKKIARGVDCPEGIIKRPDFYASQDYFEHIAIAAISRAEQAKMEVKK